MRVLLKNDIITLFRVGNWHDKNLFHELELYTKELKIFEEKYDNRILQQSGESYFVKPNLYLLNDAESHLLAHTDLYKNPIMSVCLGSSLGFAISDRQGKIVKTLNGYNFDIGEMSLPTRASNKAVWWALGKHGLSELQSNMGFENGTKHYGYRLGALLVSLCSIFRPKTIVLSGGITEKNWFLFKDNMLSEFNKTKPDWLDETQIKKSPFCDKAALIGMVKFIKNQSNK